MGRDLLPVVRFFRLSRGTASLGHIAFRVEVRLRATPTEARFTGEARAHRRAFLSYSSTDRVEVLKRAQAFRAEGVEIFQDILDIEPGERWRPRLIEEIAKADVFYLFWSGAARKSKWVRKETRQAVRRQRVSTAGAPSIIPIVLENPPPSPPRFLRHLHFNDPIALALAGAAATDRQRS